MSHLRRLAERSVLVMGLTAILLGGGPPTWAQAPVVIPRIRLEGASATWNATLNDPQDLRPVAAQVTPRIVVEYAAGAVRRGLEFPAGIESAARDVSPKIVVEHASAAWSASLGLPEGLVAAAREVGPRIVVEYAAAGNLYELVRPPIYVHLVVGKTASQQIFAALDERITYAIVVSNMGNHPISDIVVEDDITGERWTLEVLAPGDSETIEATYVVTQDDLDAGEIANTATAIGMDPLEREVRDSDSATVTAMRHAELGVVKTGDRDTYEALGEEITYTILVTNTAEVTVNRIVVEDDLTGESWAIESLAPGASETFDTAYAITQEDLDAGKLTNTATATGEDPQGNPVTASDDARAERFVPPIPAIGTLEVVRGEVLQEVADEAPASVLLVVDASFSMRERVEGRPKIDIAQEVLLDVVEVMPDILNVGLMVFRDCGVIDVDVPVVPLDRDRLSEAIKAIRPRGSTPIAGAIDLVPSVMEGHPEPYLVILVSDGMETCRGNPVQAARDLMAKGYELRMHVIGYDVERYARVQQQLREIAAEAGGRYFSADSTRALVEAFILITPVAYEVYDSDDVLVYAGIVGDEGRELPTGSYSVVMRTVMGELFTGIVIQEGITTTLLLDYVEGVFRTRIR